MRKPIRDSVGTREVVRGMGISETPWMTVPKPPRTLAASRDRSLIER
jgi:hypothetical protein